MKFRAKINAPFVKKDKIYEVDDKGFYGMNLSHSYYEIMLNNYPDLFEPVEEKSNQEKWRIFLEKFFYGIYHRMDREVEVFYSLTDSLAARLDKLGYSADKICKEVCGEG